MAKAANPKPTRTRSQQNVKSTPKSAPKSSPRRKKRGEARKKVKKTGAGIESQQESEQDEQQEDSEDEYEDTPATNNKEYDSDALDDSSSDEVEVISKESKKRKRSTKKSTALSGSASPRKRQKQKKTRSRGAEGDEDEEEEDEEGETSGLDLKEGQEVVGVVVQAPKKGQVPPGQISKNTFNFLEKLKDPECNDREWFKLHEPVYRAAEREWKDFIDTLTTRLTEVDTQVPPLPPKDVIHRIYRDIRFSNDKTPYKRSLSASFSRSGRKGIFAGYHVSIQPGGQSIIAAGSWCPGKNELTTIRANIQRNPTRLRRVISSPEFVKYFGEPRALPEGGKQNVFGGEDELKTAPKGVDKNHKDIDLLKCRSFAVVHRFLDSEVLDPEFVETLVGMVKIMRPLVHCLNGMMTIRGGGGGSDEEEDNEDE